MYLRYIILLAITLFYVSGCGQDDPLSDSATTELGIGFCLAPAAQTQYNITRIELTVSASDIDEPRLFQITDINLVERSARGLIRVPVATSMTLFAKAFEGDCPALSGSMGNVTPDEGDSVIIQLNPVQIVIGIRSGQERLNVGDPYNLEVYLEDAPRLAAFTCELEFDEDLLEPLEIVPGDFFGEEVDFLFMEDSDFPRREQNRLALGITLKGDNVAGVCGSGVVFRLTFGATGRGNAEITLLENITLITPAFEQIEEPSRINMKANSLVRIE